MQTSYLERHALQIHKAINEDMQRDPFDADYCPTEALAPVIDRADLSHRPAVVPTLPTLNRDTARAHLAAVKAMLAKPAKQVQDIAAREALRGITCWRDTPEIFRKHIARLAGLNLDVAAKMDRDLSETEKAMLRSAARDMQRVTAGLVAL
jgi:hypothetical protein